MAKSVIKFWDKVILLLLGFSGIVYSCARYGMIEAEYEIKGTVTDKTKKPIQNIQVINQYERDTLYTDSDGKFYLKGWGEHVRLKIEDIDGEANGGEFAPMEIDVEFTDRDLVKRGRNNKTPDKYAKTINIALSKVDDVVQPEYGVRPAPFKE